MKPLKALMDCVLVVLLTPCFAQDVLTRVTEGPFPNDPGYSYLPSWGDYDGDGWLDLFIANGGNEGPTVPFLYRNNRDGTFTRMTINEVGALADDPVQAAEGNWGDYDNDGDLDLFIGSAKQGDPCRLYLNEGNGRFQRVVQDVGINQALWPWGSAWADYDNDGLLDLYLARGWISDGMKDMLWRNQGDGTFLQGEGIPFRLMDVNFGTWGDADDDGDMDLLVGNFGSGYNAFYRNHGAGAFADDASAGLGPEGNGATLPVWADFNNDGSLDVFLGRNKVPCYYFQNNKNGTFKSMSTGPHSETTGVLNAAGDYDNDGDLDLVIRQARLAGADSACLVFSNNGDGTFTSVVCRSLTEDRANFSACAWADYDNDGALDLIVTTGANQSNVLYHNNGNTNAWLLVRLVGTTSNRDALGAKVRASAGLWRSSVQQMRQIGGGSLGDPRAHFGLGDATNVTTLRIEWPSGIVQELTNVAANQILTITEPARLVPLGPREFQIRCWKGMKFEVERSPDLQTWASLGVVTNETGTLVFQDTQGDPQTAACFYRVVSR